MLKKEPVWIFTLVFAAVAAGLAYVPASVADVIPPELIILLVAGIGGALVRRFVTPTWKADDSVRLAEKAMKAATANAEKQLTQTDSVDPSVASNRRRQKPYRR